MLHKLAVRPPRPQRPLQPLPLPPRLVSDLNSVRIPVDRRAETRRILPQVVYSLGSRTSRTRMKARFPFNYAVRSACHPKSRP